MSENDIAAQFEGLTPIKSVKLIKDKVKGTPVGYGFVEFPDSETASDAFNTLNGKPIPGHPHGRVFKLNRASHGGGVARAGNSSFNNHNNMGGQMRNDYPG